MEFVMKFYAYLSANYMGILMAMASILTTAQLITRLTPTKEDDAFVARLSNILDKVFDILKVPNVRRDGGSLMPKGSHDSAGKKLSMTGAVKKE